MHNLAMAKRDSKFAALDYLRFVMQELHLSASGLAKLAGLSSTTLTRPLNDSTHQFALTMSTLEKIRAATGFDFAPFLSEEMDTLKRSMHMYFEHAHEYDPRVAADRAPLSAANTIIPVLGEVAAGIWREVQFLDSEALFGLFMLPTFTARQSSVIGLLVKGESLNKIARENDVLVVEILAESGGVARDGDLVIVERRRDQEGIVEVTAKRLRNGSTELWPESTDSRFQEPLKLDQSEGDVVQIIGLVHYIVRQP